MSVAMESTPQHRLAPFSGVPKNENPEYPLGIRTVGL
ncbi:hypothetical protein R69927_02884 [Paraburkholderia domus]|uniref:Uncharacterized protein n=1 Tax=Paraburkholderia domus TaxID=2793075 RepID=A0A9N8R0T8_9BURK|nr:hypothetical protein R75483_01638 [Paraburkholderia domus]CAE6745457.1 hypothetical protein R70006_02793 [Paraburkholderia domus]CAE6809805.1 hypothetical protein R69749_03019 [Paraburkholderia domus]CAE6852350.1 hypothetical protein R70199_00417 [Paraburkholderia domus]CAE6865181.1 hypothetical protein R69927_02884 [Paraburkholderia domus]